LNDQKAIEMLLPYIRKASEQKVKLDGRNWLDEPFHKEIEGNFCKTWTLIGDIMLVSAYIEVGKCIFRLSYIIDDDVYEYERNCNGKRFNLIVDLQGNIIKGG